MSNAQRRSSGDLRVEGCLFCSLADGRDRTILVEDERFFAVEDQFPVNPGHTLLIPKRHVSRFTELRDEELLSFSHVLKDAEKILAAQQDIDGFNIGINEGEAAGQTIEHLHIHLIPRYKGDVENPRGGIRNLKPALVEY
jgi:diadenosine tetraphosphate (Ap4A) HIT family hydrolase